MRFLIIHFLVQILLFLGLFYGIKASVFFNFSLSANHGRQYFTQSPPLP